MTSPRSLEERIAALEAVVFAGPPDEEPAAEPPPAPGNSGEHRPEDAKRPPHDDKATIRTTPKETPDGPQR